MTLEAKPATIHRVCSECGNAFEIPPDEQALLQQIAEARGGEWSWPNRCYSCRRARRRAAYGQAAQPSDDMVIACVTCGGEFHFGGRDAEYFASRGFERPRRCRPCRQARAGVTP